MSPTYPDVTVQLTGTDGNAFAVMGTVAAAIRAAHGSREADSYVAEAMDQPSYDALLGFTMATVHVR